jgi:hypothetical protein
MVATAGYGMRLRSDGYRQKMEATLSAFFDLPCDIGAIRPLTFSSRAFYDVALWLEDRRAVVFRCRRAVWHEQKENGKEICDLDLHRGALSVVGDAWKQEDYVKVLRSGLAHDFARLNLNQVRLNDFSVDFRRGGLVIICDQADGLLTFSDGAEGIARLTAAKLNGYRTTEPVQVNARFVPIPSPVVHELVLTVPEIPLTALALDSVLRGRLSQGRFAGRIEYHESGSGPLLSVSGRLEDVELAEVTGSLPWGPLSGRLNITIDDAHIRNRIVTHLAGRGQVRGVSLSGFARLLGRMPQGSADPPGDAVLSGTADLNIRAADIALGKIKTLVVDGRATDLSLSDLTALFGRGAATGKLEVLIRSIQFSDDAIAWADVEVRADPPSGEPAGTISRDLLLGAVQELFEFSWPTAIPQTILPEHIEFTRFRLRLLVVDNELRVLGTYGPGHDTILTVRILGKEIPLVKSLRRVIDLKPYLDAGLSRLRTQDPRRLREWWQPRNGAPERPPN